MRKVDHPRTGKITAILRMPDDTYTVLRCEDKEMDGRPGVRRITQRVTSIVNYGRALECAAAIKKDRHAK